MVLQKFSDLHQASIQSEPVFVQSFDGTTVLPKDYGEGLFYWDSTSVQTAFPGLISTSAHSSTGRWKRLINSIGYINCQWVGIHPSVLPVDNTTRLNDLLVYLSGNGGTVFFPEGVYNFNNTIILPTNTCLQGSGATQQALFNWGNKKGTVLLFNIDSNKTCIEFKKSGSKISLKDLSVYINNNNAIFAVVSIVGVTYAVLENVEIGSTKANPGVGLYLSSETSNSDFSYPKETLYGVFNKVTIAANDVGNTDREGTLLVGLKIIGQSYNVGSIVYPSVVNSNTFNGCQFNARKYPLYIDKNTSQEVHSQSLTFVGCSFESYYFEGYSNINPPELVLKTNKLHGLPDASDWLIFKWIFINAAWTTTFTGCYFELQNLPNKLPFEGNIYKVQSAVLLNEKTVSVAFQNCRHTGAILDLGISNSATCLPNGYDYYRYEKARLTVTKSISQQIIPYQFVVLEFDNTPGGFPDRWDFQSNIIDFVDQKTIVIKERGTYYFNIMVSFPIDFPLGANQFCAIKVVTPYGILDGTYLSPHTYGSGSTTDMIASHMSCMATLNEGDQVQCFIIQNTGNVLNTGADPVNNYLNVFKI